MNTINQKPMTIGELWSSLKRKPEDTEVMFDFAYFRPKGCGSYRGDYAQPSIGYGTDAITVAGVLELLEKLTSEEFVGYKGGNYRYDDSQVLRVANYGEACNTVIVDVVNDDCGRVRLLTTFDLGW